MVREHDFAAKIVADSVSPAGVRLTTMQLCYPRFIHAEFMTHRVFSRNASSSRAIPVAKMIEQVRTNPAMPVHWGKNQPGMQAMEEIQHVGAAQDQWRRAARNAADLAEEMTSLGLHKQVANRILEPFQWMHVIVTATEWSNFFALRDHHMAEPNIQKLAKLMKAAMDGSEPVPLMAGEWHLPYVERSEMGAVGPIQTYLRGESGLWNDSMFNALCVKLSTARCARVSYLNHDGTKPEIEKDLALYEQLVVRKEGNNDPIHASPAEHQATPDGQIQLGMGSSGWATPNLHGNLTGWIQHRKLLELGREA